MLQLYDLSIIKNRKEPSQKQPQEIKHLSHRADFVRIALSGRVLKISWMIHMLLTSSRVYGDLTEGMCGVAALGTVMWMLCADEDDQEIPEFQVC